MRKPKAFEPDDVNEEEGDQPEEENQDQQQKKFQWVPKHRAGYQKQERLA
jgi:hypothetical protein